jgi:hypothetical protein
LRQPGACFREPRLGLASRPAVKLRHAARSGAGPISRGSSSFDAFLGWFALRARHMRGRDNGSFRETRLDSGDQLNSSITIVDGFGSAKGARESETRKSATVANLSRLPRRAPGGDHPLVAAGVAPHPFDCEALRAKKRRNAYGLAGANLENNEAVLGEEARQLARDGAIAV